MRAKTYGMKRRTYRVRMNLGDRIVERRPVAMSAYDAITAAYKWADAEGYDLPVGAYAEAIADAHDCDVDPPNTFHVWDTK